MDNAQVEDVAMNWSSNLKIRGLQGKCVLDKKHKKLQEKTINYKRKQNEIGFNLDIQPEH